VGTVCVAERIGGGGRDDGHVDLDLSVLDGLPAASVRTEHAHTAHLSVRAVLAQRPIHAPLDVVHDAALHQLDDGLVAGERGAGKPHQVLRPESGRRLQRHDADEVAVSEVVVGRDDHAV
jgi:hypothetical protein